MISSLLPAFEKGIHPFLDVSMLYSVGNTYKQYYITIIVWVEFIPYKLLFNISRGEIVQETAPLVIPMKPNTLVTAERLKKIAEEVESAMEEPDPGEKLQSPVTSDEKPTKAETLDQMAVRELLEDAKKEKKVNTSELTLPVPSKPVMDGQKEVKNLLSDFLLDTVKPVKCQYHYHHALFEL